MIRVVTGSPAQRLACVRRAVSFFVSGLPIDKKFVIKQLAVRAFLEHVSRRRTAIEGR